VPVQFEPASRAATPLNAATSFSARGSATWGNLAVLSADEDAVGDAVGVVDEVQPDISTTPSRIPPNTALARVMPTPFAKLAKETLPLEEGWCSNKPQE